MSRRLQCPSLVACTLWLAALPALSQPPVTRSPVPSGWGLDEPAAPAFAGRPDEQAAAPFFVGLGVSINDPPEAAGALRTLGVNAMRIDAPWQSIERVPNQYRVPAWLDAVVDTARAGGAEPLLILAYGNRLYGGDKPVTPAAIQAFARYASHVAQHFHGRVRYFDLWNEWNTRTGHTTPGTAEAYAALARRVYPALKVTNPDAVVLSGGITSSGLRDGWIEAFIAAGGLRYVDALSIHPYNYQDRDPVAPENAIAKIDRVHALAAAAGRALPIFVTEMGYPSFDGRGGVSDTTAANYLARFMLLASTRPHIAGVWWYTLRDHGTDARNKEHHFGVLDTALRPKPAATAIRSVARMLADVGRFSDASTGSTRRITGVRHDGADVELAWDPTRADDALLDSIAAGTAGADGSGRRRRADRPPRCC